MNDLRQIPGIGKNIEQDLINIGYDSVASLVGQNPEDIYLKDSLYKGFQEDKCQLYVFRLAVYYSENEIHDPEKLKWWYWKDKKYTSKYGSDSR
ncbi:helix-hairpin-helix domain-containing protein [Caproicibacter fermentans]|uniref:Pathogenicity locus n=1 Tax=Caproicibacter fermentans TaxID=2576756 RepID=A0A7G8TAU7_9FIRM|nr:helix-hairpin-helix domain-containing protein [Caproicibacter fermentans]QNK40738.1 Pathogenicity locus [Caproicibacter fermentans]